MVRGKRNISTHSFLKSRKVVVFSLLKVMHHVCPIRRGLPQHALKTCAQSFVEPPMEAPGFNFVAVLLQPRVVHGCHRLRGATNVFGAVGLDVINKLREVDRRLTSLHTVVKGSSLPWGTP